MKNSKRNRPNGWRELPIEDLLSLEYGKSFPKKKRAPGPFAVYGSNGIVDRAHQYLLEESTIIVGRKGSAGEINIAEPQSWPIDTTYYVKLKDRRIFSLDFIYYLLKWLDPRRFIETTTKPGLNRDRVYEQVVPVPPLPVQERIVEILQKADEIRHKRQEALELADAILPSIFNDMFGTPDSNPQGYLKTTVGKVTDLVTSGYTPRGGAQNYVDEGPLLIRSQNVRMLHLDLSDCAHIPESIHEDMARVRVLPGDVLLNITGASIGRVAWVGEDIPPANVNQHVCIIRTRKDILAPEYLAYSLSTPWYQHIILNAPGSAQTGFNHARVRALEILVPPMPIQKSFVAQVEALRHATDKCIAGMHDIEATFQALMARAFPGKLTAEWEKANAEWIAEQVEFHEQLPRLILLAFLRERANRAGRKAKEAAILVTAMMKYAFLLQMEGNGRRRLYQFVPYHYGPFAKDLYADLEKLQEDGLVTVDNDTDEDKTRIILADSTKADDALAVLPDDLKEDISAILNTYGDLDHNALLKTVYEKYPVYAKKSRIRKARKASSAGKKRGRRPRK